MPHDSPSRSTAGPPASEAEDGADRKKAVEALERAEQRYRALIENVSDLITVLDADGTLTYASASAEALLGLSPSDLAGSIGLDFVHPDDRERVGRVLAGVLSEEGSSAREVYRIVSRDGAVRHVESVANNLLHVPAVAGIVVNTRDVTDRVELESQLLQSQKMEAVGSLAGGVAHDFNNLLTVIEGHGSLLQSRLAGESPLRESAEEILGAARQASALTRQLLAFSKRQVLQPRVMRLNDAVADMENMLRRLIGVNVDLEVILDPRTGYVRADPGQIQQVILNLVVNARDALPNGGRIVLRTGRDASGDSCFLSVSDDGVGIPEAIQPRVFEPFFTTKNEGTGLGLATVFGVVEQSEGQVQMKSRPGAGTTFTISLPQVEGTPAETPAESRNVVEDQTNATILLVEDDGAVRSVTRRILAACGYVILEASNGSEALAIAERHEGPIDLLLSDVVLPRMNGTEVAERVTRLRPDARVLLMSGYSEDSVVAHGVLEPGIHFLQKPFSLDALVERVRDTLQAPLEAADPGGEG